MAYQILVVDDEPALRMMVQEILTQAGYAVCLAGSCREALTQRAQVHPDAILLDVMLPDGDGFSLLGQLRQQGDVPVLFLSARDEDEARLRGLGLGADDYITKPFLAQELLLRLHAVLRRVYRAASEEEPARLGHGGPLGDGNPPAGWPGGPPHRQGVCPAEKALGEPRQHCHHRRPLSGPVGGAHGGL